MVSGEENDCKWGLLVLAKREDEVVRGRERELLGVLEALRMSVLGVDRKRGDCVEAPRGEERLCKTSSSVRFREYECTQTLFI